MLNRRLSSNLLTANEDINFNLDDIHVPLVLVERDQPDKRPGETRAEDGSQLYEPTGYKENQRFAHQQFLDDILGKGEGKTKGRQIAIIGEPGAGKTTLLQKIAFWILDKRSELPIWISLADLQGRELGDYLLKIWLKKAIFPLPLSEKVKQDFGVQLKRGQVWLLLDGVDEMAIARATTGLPPQQIDTHLEGGIALARVVLTCRLNVWAADQNLLKEFETYRMLNFKYPTQVEALIRKWFEEHSDAAKGEALCQELAKAEYQRLQDLVKNPLRLTLLCRTWQTSEGLPETQAELYKRFVHKCSPLQQKSFPTTETKRDELTKALGKLARQGLDDPASPFRLRHQSVRKLLGDSEDKNSLFKLALNLYWLNEVGVAAEDETEKVYAFYHATFQEYFAAFSIKNWKFFLPKKHCGRPVPGKCYRIFEPLWKQPILLWFGSKDVPTERKQEFIDRLFNFEDGCGDFYGVRSDYLAQDCLEEFDKILEGEYSLFDSLSQSSYFSNQFENRWLFCGYELELYSWGLRKNQLFLELYECLETKQISLDMLMAIVWLFKNINLRYLTNINPEAICYLIIFLSAIQLELFKISKANYTEKQKTIWIKMVGKHKVNFALFLADLIIKTQTPLLLTAAAESLYKIVKETPVLEVVPVLKPGILDEDKNCTSHSARYWSCYNLLKLCANKISYNEFYDVWQDPTLTD